MRKSVAENFAHQYHNLTWEASLAWTDFGTILFLKGIDFVPILIWRSAYLVVTDNKSTVKQHSEAAR